MVGLSVSCLVTFHFLLIFQVPVKSISQFQKLYISRHNSRKPVQKITMDLPRRSHKGLIVHVSPVYNDLPTGKMNFVDLAGSDLFTQQNKYCSAFLVELILTL